MAKNLDTGLPLQGIENLDDLITELDMAFNRDQIHLLTDDDSISWQQIKNQILDDVRFITYNSDGLPTLVEFVAQQADGTNTRGKVEYRYTDFRVTQIVIDFPADTRFAEIQVNHNTGSEPWKLKSTELYFR